MSGHSKWSTIKRKKGALDAKRGKAFTKVLKEITMAAKAGGGDPAGNAWLRLAIQNAKGINCPKENIDRAIKKGIGADASSYLEVTYEGYGPNGIAIFVECTTDNLNRTVQNVRSLFNKYNGSLGTNGSLEFIFTRKGIFNIPIPENLDQEAFTFDMIDCSAEDVEFEDGFITVFCQMEDFGKTQKRLEELHLEPESAGLQRIPSTMVHLDDEALKKVIKLIDALEDDDDVQKVYHNLDITETQLLQLME